MKFINSKLESIFNKKLSPPYLQKAKSCKNGCRLRYNLANQDVIYGLKDFIIKNNLPILNRKWNKIKL